MFHEFTRSLRDFYSRLHSQVDYGGPPQEVILQRADEHRRAVRGQRALQLINARDAWRFRDARVAHLFDRLHLHDMLAWHRQRFVVAQSDARLTEYQYLRTAADAYGRQAAKVLRSPAATALAGQLIHIESPELVSLMDQSERDVTVAFTYLGAAETDAWVILQYDPDLISVRAPPHVYHEHELAGRFDEDLSDAEVGEGTGIHPGEGPHRGSGPVEIVQLRPALGTGHDVVRHLPLLYGQELTVEICRKAVSEVAVGQQPSRNLQLRQHAHRPPHLLDTAELVVRFPVALEQVDNEICFLGTQLTIEESGDQLLAAREQRIHSGHVNSSLSILRPRWIRLRTVPTGMSVASAISS